MSEEILVAVTWLRNLKESLPTWEYLPERFVDQFHQALEQLKPTGVNVSAFRIPKEEVKPYALVVDTRRGRTREEYTHDNHVERSRFLARLDAVLLHLEQALQEEQGPFEEPQKEKPANRIGFSAAK